MADRRRFVLGSVLVGANRLSSTATLYDKVFRFAHGQMEQLGLDLRPGVITRFTNLFTDPDRNAPTDMERVARRFGRNVERFTSDITANPYNWRDSVGYRIYRSVVSAFVPGANLVGSVGESILFSIVAVGQIGARYVLYLQEIIEDNSFRVFSILRVPLTDMYRLFERRRLG